MPVIAQAPSGLRLVVVVRRREPRGVALELLDHAEQIMRDGRRLRRLRVRMRGENGLACAAIRQIDQRRSAAPARCAASSADELALADPVHRHVDVVAAARGVQPAGHLVAAGIADELLDIEEQVLARAVEGDAADTRRARCCPGRRAACARRPRVTMPRSASITRCA